MLSNSYLTRFESSPHRLRLKSHPKSLECRTDRSFPLFFPPTFNCSIISLFLSKVETLMERKGKKREETGVRKQKGEKN